MYKASNSYVSVANELTRHSKTKIVLDGVTYDGSKYIKTYPKFSHENETMIGGFPIKSCSFEFWVKDEYVDFVNKEFTVYRGLVINESIEWIPQGIFKSTEEDIKTSDTGLYLSITGYDRTKDTASILYEDTEIYPCQSLTYIRNVLQKYGYELENEDFPHSDVISKRPNYIEKTYLREVISRFAEMRGCIAIFSRTGKVEIKRPTETGLKYYLYQYKKLTKELMFGPIDMVVLGRKNINNDITYPSTNVLPNPQFEWRIEDNPFLDLVREESVESVFNDIKGVSVIPFSATNMLDNFLLDLNDVVEIQKKDGAWFKATILSIKTENRIRCEIKSSTQNKTISKYALAGSVKNELDEFRLDVDHQNKKIEGVISQTNEQNEKISKVTQTVDDLTSKISNIADITTSGESNFGFVNLENINQSEPIQIKIHPVGEDISYLYPSDDLYPSDTLFSKNRVLRFTNTVTEEFYDYELPEDLLYYDENTYDEFLLNYDSQTCYINKKLRHTSVNGINELLEQSQIIELEYPKISLSDGNYKIELLGYQNGYIYCQLMAANIYTTQFATRVEMNSKISQTAEEINNTVSKKVGDDEIISKINQTAEGIKILANKLGLTANDVLNIIAGNEINLTSQNISINSTNFKVDKDGNVVANNGTFNGKINSKSGEIAGWSVTENGLTNGTVFLNKDGSSTIYTVADLIIMRGYIMDTPGFSFSKAMIEHYDLNGDGVVNAQDYAMLQKLIGISMG